MAIFPEILLQRSVYVVQIKVFCEEIPPPDWKEKKHSKNGIFLDIWRIPLSLSKQSFETINGFLSDEERAQAHRFAQKADRNRYILGRGFLRKLLQVYLNEDNGSLRFGKNRYNKPFLLRRDEFHFNSSHGGDWVVIALSGNEVGIDIERIDPRFTFEELLPTFFSESEIAYIRQSPRPIESFYTIWTRKEALLKGIGLGITDHLNEYTLLSGSQEMLLPSLSPNREWQVRSFSMDPTYRLSLAFPQRNLQLRFFHWDCLFPDNG
ncbi:4'-phosphopantetheinyl transferase family protein [Cyclobacterium xiamenense]|uniref:4'-phosphopantetheinyl transferase family protein n=1 Tax=Cyclobacterium xiamenense TaxID=1297121 RepID=UPI0012B763F5|nr:4'-phosphopantetheinyl transferase superfamily protein [Cyclobacterium xiamenense]